MIAVQCCIIAIAVALSIFDYRDETLNSIAFSFATLTAFAFLLRRLEIIIVPDMIEIISLLLSLMIVTPLCTIVLASANLPIADPLLRQMDRIVFPSFDREQIETLLSYNASILSGLNMAYYSLSFQPFLLVPILCSARSERRAWHFVTAWAIALTITALVSPLFPAYGTSPHLIDAVETHMRVRNGGLRVLGEAALRGIVYFPSFHAAAAILLGWAFAPIRVIGRPMVFLNTIMFISALVCGNHYLVDLLAGGAVAVFSIWSSGRLLTAITTTSPNFEPPHISLSIPRGLC